MNQPGQRRLSAFCFITALVEGFDLQAAGVVAPALSDALALTPRMLGAFFSASVLGLMIGTVAGGWLADRFGRKIAVVGGLATFGVASIATALSGSFAPLLISRLLTGIGIGAVMPAVIALIA